MTDYATARANYANALFAEKAQRNATVHDAPALERAIRARYDAEKVLLQVHPLAAEGKQLSIWDNYVLERRVAYGSAARGNRGRYSGSKVHRLECQYVVGVVDPLNERPGTIGAQFLRTHTPQLFSAHPACGCTQGQRAGLPSSRYTEADVTCAKCNA